MPHIDILWSIKEKVLDYPISTAGFLAIYYDYPMRLHVTLLLANKRTEFLARYLAYLMRLHVAGLLANHRAEFLAIYLVLSIVGHRYF